MNIENNVLGWLAIFLVVFHRTFLYAFINFKVIGRSCLIPVSIHCRRPIEERVVHALGKAWHVEVIVATRWNILTHFEIISKVLYSSVREFYWKLSVLKKKSKNFVFHKRIVWIPAFCLCQMWAAIFWNSPLWEERAGLLWDSLPSGLYPKWTVCEGSLIREVENDILSYYCFHTVHVSVYIKGSVIEIPYRHTVDLLWLK